MNKDKNNALSDYIAMIIKSWTYARLTQDERDSLLEAFTWTNEQGILRGTYRQRWDTLQAIYTGFLYALGYDKNKVGWRETDKEAPLF